MLPRARGMSFGKWLQLSGKRAPNAQSALTQWFDRVLAWTQQIKRDHPRTSHAQLAQRILAEINLVRGLVERIDAQADKHFIVLEAMMLMRAVRDLEHNLALLKTVDSRRRSTAQLGKARRSKKCPYTQAQYDDAASQAGGKLYRLAALLKHDAKTVRKYGRPSS
jgi:DNA-binding helix-hairpin-helix protein with protein kinase domain